MESRPRRASPGAEEDVLVLDVSAGTIEFRQCRLRFAGTADVQHRLGPNWPSGTFVALQPAGALQQQVDRGEVRDHHVEIDVQ